MSTSAEPWLHVEDAGGITILRFRASELRDHGVVQAVADEMSRAAAGSIRLLLDFSLVNEISSSMLAKLIDENKRFQAKGGHMVLYSLRPAVYDLLAVTQSNRLFTVCPDHNAALASLAGPSKT
jgi:anti-anti-sigma factor